MTQKSAGPTPSNAAGIEGEVERLQRQLDQLRSLQASSRRVVLLLLLIIVGEFGAFYYFTNRNITRNFSQEEVQKAVSQSAPQLTSEVRDKVMTVAQQVLPVYRDEATKRFEEVGPQIAKDALDKLQKLPEDNGKMLQDRLKVALDGAIAQVQPDLRKTYPSLTDDKKTQIIQQEFLAQVQKQNDVLARHLTDVYDGQLKTMRDVLEKFDVPSDTNWQQRMAREREFLHALVDVMMDSDVKFAGVSNAPASTMPTASAAGVMPAH